MKNKTLDDLFYEGLKDIYYAERQLLKALPKLARGASAPELKAAFQQHREQTEGHVARLQQVFEICGKSARGKTCPAIDGIIEEANEVAGEVDDKNVLDAALIAAAQAVEHYEITRYGTLITWAEQLGYDDCAEIMKQNLADEKATDEKLSELAESRINMLASE